MNERGDSDLLREYARDKSHGAFGQLVARYAGLVYSAALRHVREGNAAEDVAQAAFIVLARRAATLKEDCVLGGWLLAVTRHTARDYLKMERRRKQREQAVAEERERQSGEQSARHNEADSTLDDAMARLSTSYRDAIVLRFLQEKSFGEISALLGISEDSARQRVFRALEKLRTIMSRKQGAQVSPQSLSAVLASAATTVPPHGLVLKVTTTALNGGAGAGVPAALAKGAVTIMAYSKAKAVAVGALAFLLVGGGAVSVGYYVMKGDEPTAVARPDPAAPAARNAVPNFGYNWGVPAPAQTRPVYQGPPVAGLVLNPDGKPANGVEITYAGKNTYASVYMTSVLTGRNTPAARTTADGRFQFVPRAEKPDTVAVQNDQGVGWAAVSTLPDTPIHIIPWGRLEGVAKIGKNPAANARVGLRMLTRGNGNPPLVYVSGSAQTDSEGRFVFEKAPPGPVELDVTPQGQRPSTVRALVTVQSGSTATIAVGGMGRPVIGRVTNMPANSAGNASLMIAPPRPPRPPASLLVPTSMPTSMPSEERQKMLAAYRESPEYKAYLQEREAFAKRYGNQFPQPIQATVGADGGFRVEDVPAGVYQLNISLHDNSPTSSGMLENLGASNQQLTVADMPGGRSDDPLDVGEIKVLLQKRIAVGDTAPEIAGTSTDGKTVKLSDFHGKYVVLGVSRYRSNSGLVNAMTNMNMCVAIRDRFRDDPRLAFVAFGPKSGGMIMSDRGTPAGKIDWPVVEVQGAMPEGLTQGDSILLIDPQGKILAKNLSAPAAVAKVEEILGPPAGGSLSGVKIAVAHLPLGTPEATAYGTVPPVSASDAATGATFSVVDGVGVEPSNSTDRLKDGRAATGDDAPSQNFFFELGTIEGRLKVDMGRTMLVGQVNTYSRHKSDRAPQVYNLYASDGTATNFDASPKNGVDPGAVGWTKVAVVDTRSKTEPVGGRYAVGISGASGSIGRYRYLLFEIFPSETRDPYGQGFYSEIDVVEGR
jgi:RNA polymerase sigma factor (sigma-70 family)